MVSYCPLIQFKKYINLLSRAGISDKKIEEHSHDIQTQRITQILYLPAGAQMNEDHIAFLDRTCHANTNIFFESDVVTQRKASFNNFGFYLFLLKLSIHFTRIREGVDRV